MKDEAEQVEENENTATEMLRMLLEAGGSPLDMINTIAHLNGMVSCGLAFSVKGDVKARRKAYQIQTDIAKATRRSIELQDADAFKVLSFESMFISTAGEDDNTH